MKRFFRIFIVVLLWPMSGLSQQFQFGIYGHDAGGTGVMLTFGVHPLAHFCEDQFLGEKNNTGPPPFPFAFMWVNPRETGLCDNSGCFDCGRLPSPGFQPLDLRPYSGPTQIDTFRIFLESFGAGYPFTLSWTGDFFTYCDSMKLIYVDGSATTVTVNMLEDSSHAITDPSVRFATIIKWGATNKVRPSVPILSSPPNHSMDRPLTTTVRWLPAPNAVNYIVQLSDDSLFTSPLHNDTVTATTRLIDALSYHQQYYWRVGALNAFGQSEWSLVWSFNTITPTATYAVDKFWNLVSVPLAVDDARTSVVFPTSSSGAFAYLQNGTYEVRPTLQTGVGYWMRFDSTHDVSIRGIPQNRDSIRIVPGWNLIGSIAETTALGNLQISPPGNVISFCFGYSGGYRKTNIIAPSRGYWIKASDSGYVIFTMGTALSKTVDASSLTDYFENCNSLTLADALGNQQVLYIGPKPEGTPSSFTFEVPPAPGAGIFDVRFSSNRMLESPKKGQPARFPIVTSGVQYPLTLSWDMQGKDAGQDVEFSLEVDGRILRMKGSGEVRLLHPPSKLAVHTRSLTAMPEGFALEAAFPSPFNPSTTLKYRLPTASTVRLFVSNPLGQVVDVLWNGEQEAGDKQIEWNGSNYASGIYFYTIEAVSVSDPGNSFSQTKKMLLMK